MQWLRPASHVPSDVEQIPESVTRAVGEPGATLGAELRGDMERRFGHDFSRVRVHDGRAAAESAHDVDAQAYTAGHHIVFGDGRFNPHSQDGRRLIAHELAHVIQQSRHGSSTSSPRVLQRKPRTGAVHGDAGLADPRTISADAADPTVMLPSADDAAADQQNALANPPPPLSSAAHAISAPRSEPPPLDPATTSVQGLAAGDGDSGPVAAHEPASGTRDESRGDGAMPSIASMLRPRGEAGVVSGDRDAMRLEAGEGREPGAGQEAGAAPGLSTQVHLEDLLAQLAGGAKSARRTIGRHAREARDAIDRRADDTSAKVKTQTDVADDKVRALMKERRSQVERTVRAHDQGIRWGETRCVEDAGEYAKNAGNAQKDGFAFYRDQLAKVFDSWSDRFTKLDEKKADWLKRCTEWNIRRMWRKYSAYEKRFIADVEQSEGRRAVQRDAAYEVVEEYAKQFNKASKEITPEIGTACGNVKKEIAKSREDALREYDKVLPQILEGIEKQRDAAVFDIRRNARESRDLLAKGAKKIYEQLDDNQTFALKRHEEQHARLDGQIARGRTSAARQFDGAVAEAMAPISGVIGEAVVMLVNAPEELDPVAADRFVGEVVGFATGAAEATGEVFATARDAGLEKFDQAPSFARRGFATGRALLKEKLREAGADVESKLIEFGEEADKFVRTPLKNLDLTYQDGVEQSAKHLTAFVTATRDQMVEPMEKARKEISDAVRQAVGQQYEAYWHLGRDMNNAARQAAWRYDHDILKHVVDLVEVVLGFVFIVAVLIAVVVGLVFAFGEILAAMFIGFMIGYFGAKAYYERREKEGEEGFSLSALIGAIGDITGFTEAKRAFTDPKMKPFDRGMAWGGFWLGLVGGAQSAGKFLKFIKLKMPKAFTNPFRMERPGLPMAGEGPGLHLGPEAPVLPEAPKIEVNVPNEAGITPESPGASAPRRIGFRPPGETAPVGEVPGAGAPSTPREIGFRPEGKPAPAPEATGTGAPREIGFKLAQENAPAPETSGAGGVKQPRQIGFELPHQQRIAPEATPGGKPQGEVISPRLHHRNTAPETPSGPGKRRIGFVSSEEAAAPVSRAPAPESPGMAGESLGGVIADMPRAREMPGGGEMPTGQQSVGRPVSATAGETPRAPNEGPVTGTAVSTVKPEAQAPAPREAKLSSAAEARLADERAIQTAHETRIAAEERLAKLEEELKFIEELRDATGKKREPYVEDAYSTKSKEVRDARESLKDARRAENEAEAAQRTKLLRDPDADPSAALHDPELRREAVSELEMRRARVKENDALIKANEADLAEAEARVAQREAEFEATRPGSNEGKQSRALAEARDTARARLQSAQQHLESVRARTRPAERANQAHYKRMQDLDRVINPQNYAGELSGAKGDFGEARMHDAMGDDGYAFRGSSKDPGAMSTKPPDTPREPGLGKPSDKGLDGVYEKSAPVKGEARHRVGEAKYDQADLSPGQDSLEWVDARLDAAVGPKHANRMRAEGYEYWVMKYNPRTMRVEPTKLWEFRPIEGRFAPEQFPGAGKKPLGAAHYEKPQP